MAGRSLLLLAVFVIPAAGQFEAGIPANNHVHIHVGYSSGVCDSTTQVELMQGASSVARGTVDKSCTAELPGIPSGLYRLVISGRGFSGIETNEISVNAFDTQPIEVAVPQSSGKADLAASTSVADLRIPKRAAKEFARASRAMDEHRWDAATASLQRAIAIYPQYAAAYNNLGVVFARSGDRGREADALQHAISVDGHYVPAYVNLARMNLAENHFTEAETELKTATGFEPQNGVVLVLLAYSQYLNHHYDDAIMNSDRVHALNDVPHALAHWTAAFALEQKNEIAAAGEQFRIFVQEEPKGYRADQARKELTNIADYLAAAKK